MPATPRQLQGLRRRKRFGNHVDWTQAASTPVQLHLKRLQKKKSCGRVVRRQSALHVHMLLHCFGQWMELAVAFSLSQFMTVVPTASMRGSGVAYV